MALQRMGILGQAQALQLADQRSIKELIAAETATTRLATHSAVTNSQGVRVRGLRNIKPVAVF